MTVVRARPTRRLPWVSCALALGVTAILTSCYGNSSITYGTALISLGDVSGDFTSYIVAIDSIILTRSDGLVVEPLATPQLVDLTKLKDVSEVIAGAAVPVGTYISLTLALDYSAAASAAEITVDVNGQGVVATPLGVNGVALAPTSLTVTFDPNNPLVITAGVSTRLAIDIDLAASNTVNTTATPLTVTVQPFAVATPAPADSTLLRARGLLVITQPSSSDYVINVRPFHDLVSALGAVTVTTSASTYFNINGVSYTGAAGLAALNTLQLNSPVAAYGTLGSLSGITPTFNATSVYAGASLESPLADFLTGIVSARSGDTLTVHGATFASRLGALAYVNAVPVTIGNATIVSEDGVAASALTAQSVSVGQQITLSGQSTFDTTTGVLTSMDATAGQVRLAPTPIWGTLNPGAAAGSMSLNLASLGDFEPAAFTFTGTGTAAGNDAVAASYAVNTGSLNESAVPTGTMLEAQGIVSPFGSAPPDFTASAVSLGSATTQELVVEWHGGSTAPFSSHSSSGLVVDLASTNIDTIHYISTGPTKLDLTTLPASPMIGFASGTQLTLAIGNSTGISVFNSAAGFATALATTLNGTKAVYRLACVGQYASATNTFTASRVSVALQE
ncbi:MAG: DUF4382 domain-containing protein [Steroidobacteraceae bacterium]